METETKRIYNRIAEKYHKFRKRGAFYNEYLEVPATFSLLKNLRNKRVLDLGCGTGIYSTILKEKGAKVFGLDISHKMLEIAMSEVKGVDFRLGSVYKLPYRSNYFDVVVAALVVEYFKNLEKAFREIRRVLKKGGYFVFSITNPVVDATYRKKGRNRRYRFFDDYFKEGKKYSQWKIIKMPGIHRTYQTWIRTIVRNGFTIEDYVDAKPTKNGEKMNKGAYRFTSKVPYFCVFKIRKS